MDDILLSDGYRKFFSEIKLLADRDGYVAELPLDLITLPASLKSLKHSEKISRPTEKHGRTEIETIKVVVSISDTNIASSKANIFCFEGYDQLAKALVDGNSRVRCIAKKIPRPEAVIPIFEKHLSGFTGSARPHPVEIAADLKVLSETGMKLKDVGFVLNKSDKTIARLRKITRWSHEIKDLITKDPKKFPARFIFLLASKRLSPTEVESEIKSFNPEHMAHEKKQKLLEKIKFFFQEKSFSEAEQNAVYLTLKFLKIL